jgi:two-component system response regulator ChvI
VETRVSEPTRPSYR